MKHEYVSRYLMLWKGVPWENSLMGAVILNKLYLM